VRGRILPSVKFKRESTKLLRLSEITKPRNNNKVEVPKGKVPLFGRSITRIILDSVRTSQIVEVEPRNPCELSIYEWRSRVGNYYRVQSLK
jgi:hypothetical protein